MKKQLFFSLLILFTLLNTVKAQWSLTGNTGTTPGTNYIGTTDNKDIVFKTNATAEKLRITSAGTTLLVNGNQQIGSGVTKIGLGSAYSTILGTGTGYLGFNAIRHPGSGYWTLDCDASSNGGGVIWGTTAGGINFAAIPSTGGAGPARTLTDAQINSNVKMCILSNGNVGIGKSAPTQKFEVMGSIALSEKIYGNSATFHSLDIYGGSGTGAGIVAIGDGTVNQKTVKIISPGTDGDIQFWTGNKNSTSMVVRNTDVVFGSPTNLVDLKVNGKVNAREVQVSLTTWWDKVFAEDYTLMPISELSTFITTNNHLPEIPSEKEVLADGINIGEMNALLLKKIEELTLYLISQQKQIDELKETIKK